MCCMQNEERPLHIAARHGHVKMAEALLHDDANPQLKSSVNISPVYVNKLVSCYNVIMHQIK